MTAQEVFDYLKEIQEIDPDAMKLQVTFEHKGEWSGYHMSPGCAKRGQHNKPSQVVFRLET